MYFKKEDLIKSVKKYIITSVSHFKERAKDIVGYWEKQ